MLIEARGVSREFDGGLVRALDSVDLSIREGEILSITGPSGCGKSTLLNILGTLDFQTSGELLFQGRPVGELGALPAWRAANVGFVFQFHHLIPTMTLAENVEAALVPLGVRKSERRERARRELEMLGMGHRADFFPAKVSGGERQRAAIARALVTGAKLVLADEPTGQLDHHTGEMAARHIIERCMNGNTALLMVTHNPEIAAMAQRRLSMLDGRLAQEA